MQRLLALNHQFYQTFALQFSATRQRIQPGVRRLIHGGWLRGDLLDLGCGNAELARALHTAGFDGHYTGVDFSPRLLEAARAGLPRNLRVNFVVVDLGAPSWVDNLPAGRFDCICAFAVMHHLPGSVLRDSVLAGVRQRLNPGGVFLHSNWQFLNSPRLAARVQPWAAAGLHEDEVEPGDYLLDWRSGGAGLRYVHLFSEEELGALAARHGFRVVETFLSDGEGERLGLYGVWQALLSDGA